MQLTSQSVEGGNDGWTSLSSKFLNGRGRLAYCSHCSDWSDTSEKIVSCPAIQKFTACTCLDMQKQKLTTWIININIWNHPSWTCPDIKFFMLIIGLPPSTDYYINCISMIFFSEILVCQAVANNLAMGPVMKDTAGEQCRYDPALGRGIYL